MFTFGEYADMYMVFGFCNGNANLAKEEYQIRYPQRRHPSTNTFRRLDQRLRETGTFIPNYRNSGRPRERRTVQLEEQILDAVYEDPTSSTRQIARELNIPSKTTVHSVLSQNLLHPFHARKVQPLYVNDNVHRRMFCNNILQRTQEEPNFLLHILWSDECLFTRDGVFNSHNFHFWADENPKAVREIGHQRRFSVNVWLGILNLRVVGPIFLPNRLNGIEYVNVLEEVLDNIPLNLRPNMLYMHDGAPAHNARISRDWLNEHFRNRWIGRNGPIAWPARSPDINPLDFFVWGFLKEKVYATPPVNEEDVINKITAAVRLITPDMLERVLNSLPRRLELCLETDGYQFEQFL